LCREQKVVPKSPPPAHRNHERLGEEERAWYDQGKPGWLCQQHVAEDKELVPVFNELRNRNLVYHVQRQASSFKQSNTQREWNSKGKTVQREADSLQNGSGNLIDHMARLQGLRKDTNEKLISSAPQDYRGPYGATPNTWKAWKMHYKPLDYGYGMLMEGHDPRGANRHVEAPKPFVPPKVAGPMTIQRSIANHPRNADLRY